MAVADMSCSQTCWRMIVRRALGSPVKGRNDRTGFWVRTSHILAIRAWVEPLPDRCPTPDGFWAGTRPGFFFNPPHHPGAGGGGGRGEWGSRGFNVVIFFSKAFFNKIWGRSEWPHLLPRISPGRTFKKRPEPTIRGGGFVEKGPGHDGVIAAADEGVGLRGDHRHRSPGVPREGGEAGGPVSPPGLYMRQAYFSTPEIFFRSHPPSQRQGVPHGGGAKKRDKKFKAFTQCMQFFL